MLGVVVGATFNSYGALLPANEGDDLTPVTSPSPADVGLGSVAVLFEVMVIREDVGIGALNLPSPFVEVSSLR